MIDSQYPALSRALAESMLCRSVIAVANIAVSAWSESQTARLLRTLARSASTRSVGIVVAIAGVLALLAQPMIPIYVRSGLPFAWPVVIVSACLVLAIWSPAFAYAWPQSSLGKLFERGRGGLSRRSPGEGG